MKNKCCGHSHPPAQMQQWIAPCIIWCLAVRHDVLMSLYTWGPWCSAGIHDREVPYAAAGGPLLFQGSGFARPTSKSEEKLRQTSTWPNPVPKRKLILKRTGKLNSCNWYRGKKYGYIYWARNHHVCFSCSSWIAIAKIILNTSLVRQPVDKGTDCAIQSNLLTTFVRKGFKIAQHPEEWYM